MIKIARISKHIKVKDLADMLNVGRFTIYHWEVGYTLPRGDKKGKLESILNITLPEYPPIYKPRIKK